MKKEYDFSKSVKNPYVKKLKKQISINLDAETIEYFKSLADQSGAKYQTLINMFLSECAAKGLKPNFL
ncbi:BrnA antitoxin family protein [uncultured Campylobacter sp.]|uniref:BrnA antitoxin family protein n=1 Tax=uncultured Campylobacter sp. TaxID=218934 RepID=UPI00261A226D|nr:BrnA antitoxin family protein [uncultured Campylobacter sp.]